MNNAVKRFSLVKPSLDTPFHIDFNWLKEHDQNWRVYLFSICPEHQASFEDSTNDVQIDWIDPETAEVRTVDGLQQVLITHCAHQPDFLTSNTSLVDSVFRALLASGNTPMSARKLSEEINRPPEIILRTLTGMNYKGIRPFVG